MSEGKRFSWVETGLDEKHRIQGRDLKERAAKENDITRRERARVQDDEQKSVNIHGEGTCYRCHTVDKIISSLFYVCRECLENHGDEALLNIVVQKRNVWDLCDFCEKWVWHEVCQVNCSLCDSCMKRVIRLHRAYRKGGGRKQSPDVVKRRKIYGKDYNYLLNQTFNPRK